MSRLDDLRLQQAETRIEELLELLADLAMENKILGLGDPIAEVNDQTGVLSRVRAVLEGDFLDGVPVCEVLGDRQTKDSGGGKSRPSEGSGGAS